MGGEWITAGWEWGNVWVLGEKGDTGEEMKGEAGLGWGGGSRLPAAAPGGGGSCQLALVVVQLLANPESPSCLSLTMSGLWTERGIKAPRVGHAAPQAALSCLPSSKPVGFEPARLWNLGVFGYLCLGARDSSWLGAGINYHVS